MSTGTTANFTVSRNKLIEMAHRVIGVLEPGQVLDAEMLRDGIDLLGVIVRETDAAGKWLWTMEAAAHLPLQAGVCRYTTAQGLPANIAELYAVQYRDASGADAPVKILRSEQYEAIHDKLQVGAPLAIFLTESAALANRVLYVWPMLSAVTAESVVTGTDSQAYRCIVPHTASSANQPVTGANWPMVWAQGGSGAVAWQSGAAYVCGQQLRLSYRRPIYDFDAADHEPDFPLEWPRTLLYKLAFDLGDIWGIPLEERRMMLDKARGGFDDIFPNQRAKGRAIHHKVDYF